MDQEYPPLVDRFKSTFIDTLFIILCMFLCASLIESANESVGQIRGIIFLTLFLIYEPLCTTLGCTLGNYLMKIRVRRFDEPERRINFLQALIRFVVKVSLGWLSFVIIHSNDNRRVIHDFAAGSVMIKV